MTALNEGKTHGFVTFAGAGPGDPELLTLKALRALQSADVIIHDRLVSAEILSLAHRNAHLIDAGKKGFGPFMAQGGINALIIKHAGAGKHVLRLKGGDPAIFGRLDEEIDAISDAGIGWHIIPGLTAASAAVAAIGQSLTKRYRNGCVRFLTGHDVQGFAEQDWRTLAQPGEVAAIYMGKAAARFLQGRLLMYGGAPGTPVTLVENASRTDQRIVASTLGRLSQDVSNAQLQGPALTLFGLAPRAAETVLPEVIQEEVAAHAP